jgi:hypothetical protein
MPALLRRPHHDCATAPACRYSSLAHWNGLNIREAVFAWKLLQLMLFIESQDYDTYHSNVVTYLCFKMAPRFSHLPLQYDDSIRVLRLYGSSTPDAEIYCDIIHTDLHNPLSYEAVSYTWQDQIADQVISVGHSSFAVTHNCQAALRYLRLSQKDASRVL